VTVEPGTYVRVFEQHPEGAAILADLTRRFYDQPSFVPGQPDVVAYREGRRSVLAFILQQIAHIEVEDVREHPTA
jgi:hypothetical protein